MASISRISTILTDPDNLKSPIGQEGESLWGKVVGYGKFTTLPHLYFTYSVVLGSIIRRSVFDAEKDLSNISINNNLIFLSQVVIIR